MHEIKFSLEIETLVANNAIRSSSAGRLFSMIGEYFLTIRHSSEDPIYLGVDSLDVNQYNISDAYDEILNEAKDRQIIIISEAHLKPQHRIFAKQLIRGLSEYGFKHLGLETFSSINNSNQLLDSLIEVKEKTGIC